MAQRLVIPCTPTSQELMEQKRQRQLKKQELGRRRSAASQNRMRIISQLAEDSSGSVTIISDRPFLLCCGIAGMFYVCVLCAVAGKKSSKRKEDTFGMNDDDWNVYRAIVSVVLAKQILLWS